MQGPPPGMNPIDWVFAPLAGIAPGDPGYDAAQQEYQNRLAFLNNSPPSNPTVTPPSNPTGPGSEPPGPITPPTQIPPKAPSGPATTPFPTGVKDPIYPYTPQTPTAPRAPETPPSNPTPSTPSTPALPGMLNRFNPRLHIAQGIDAGPVWTPEKTQAGVNQIRNAPQTLARNIPGLPTHAQRPAQMHLGDVTRQANDIGSLNFSRQAAQTNAQQQLSSERARAFAGGLPWLNLTLSDMQSDLGNQMQRGGALANLLAGMV